MSKPFLSYRKRKEMAEDSNSKCKKGANLKALSSEFAQELYSLSPWIEPFRKDLEPIPWGDIRQAEKQAAALLREYIPRMEMVQGFQAAALAVLLETAVLRDGKQGRKAVEDFLDFAARHQM